MRNFLLQYGQWCVCGMAAAYLVLIVLLAMVWRKNRQPPGFVHGCGGSRPFVRCGDDRPGGCLGGAGASGLQPAAVCQPRSIDPAALSHLCLRSGRGPEGAGAVRAFSVLVMLAGAAQGFATDLELVQAAGVVRYASSEATPTWAETISRMLSFGTVIPLMVCGVIAWVRRKTPMLFLSGLFMFVFAAVGPATGNMDLLFLFSMMGEVLMLLFFWLYARRQSQKARKGKIRL